jgi:hypothetical protein
MSVAQEANIGVYCLLIQGDQKVTVQEKKKFYFMNSYTISRS